ncbi:hypothetical protein PR202_gb29846 [Eleusine coracana subsp. coracana]|uniref:PRONE domain-containing protein n=1 Tax=Eleusine coracana subsp. coracana TaxID=191504 RepID=A0AAV5G158_ELECO|nr:hypothetical protein PR202_gb29846 [Eleusine coracana subsp. coracana]
MDLMMEKFSKLLLGEDMSGTGKGVSSALALSNAITNLAASVFGEQRRLEPMSVETRARWNKEIDWLLSVTDYIVDLTPSHQVSEDGTNMEVMGTQPRRDLLMNVPALQKLDAMLLGYLDNFNEAQEFWKWLHHQKDLVAQVLKAVMAINADVITEMDIPEEYIESLPKHKIVDLKDRIEASVVIWQRKFCNKLSWVSLEKREQFEERAQTVLLILKHRFPGVPQSSLDISKIQHNKDVGYAILESYSRTLESLAFTIMSRIEDVLHANAVSRDPKRTKSRRRPSLVDLPESLHLDAVATEAAEVVHNNNSVHWQEQDHEDGNGGGSKAKAVPRVPTKKMWHIQKLENVGGGLRSFTLR